jgi:hypothetical protein
VHGRLQVTIVTGTSAALAGLLCARMHAFGLPVARYRHDGNLLLRSHGSERVAMAWVLTVPEREVLAQPDAQLDGPASPSEDTRSAAARGLSARPSYRIPEIDL